jgi:hypothetical protein
MEEKIEYEKTERGITFTDGRRTAFVDKKFIIDLKEIDGVLKVKLSTTNEFVPVTMVLDAAEVDQFFKGASRSIPPGLSE